LKLQKLVYYAQAWSLTVFGKSLFEEPIEAWAHGPVVPSLYHFFKESGFESLDPSEDCEIEIEEEAEGIIEDVLSIYGEKSAKFLERLTHSEDPWIIARKGLPPERKSTEEISMESMINYYSTLRKADGQEGQKP